MGKVLQADTTATQDSYVRKNLSLAAPWTIQFDALIPPATVNNGGSGDLVQINAGANEEGTFISGTNWDTDQEPGSAQPFFTPGIWTRSIVAAYNGTNITWTYDGNQLFNYATDLGDPVDSVWFGAIFDRNNAGLYYVDNVQIRDSSNALVFQDDFESGDLSAWDSTNGSVSVVDDPISGGGGGGAQYDDIGDAYVMIVDGANHTVTIDTTNATSQDPFGQSEPGETYWLWGTPPQKSCWMVVDLTGAGSGTTVDINMRSLTPGFHPEYDFLFPGNPWDADAPDFDNLGFMGFGGGDGTENPGDATNFFTQSIINQSDTGKFYIALVDWDYNGGGGVIEITYKVTLKGAKTCIDATTVAYTASPTVSVGGGSVGDSQYFNTDGSSPAQDLLRGISDFNPTLRLEGANLPAAGQYRFYMTVDNPDQEAWYMMVKRNGLPLYPVAYLYADTGVSIEMTGYGWLNGEATINNSPAPTVIPIAPGDVIDFCMVSDRDFRANTMRITKLCFIQMSKGGIQGPPFKILGQPEILGASPPTDAISGDIPGTNSPNPGWLTGDLCITDNGNVYVIWSIDDFGHHIQLWEWNGSAWNQISNNVAGATGSESGTLERIPWVSIDAHQNTVWMAYGFNNGTTAHGLKNTAIYVKKYESGTLSSVVPSTGLLGFTHVSQYSWVGCETQSVTIKCSPSGVPWVVWPEVIDYIQASYNGGTRPIAAYYNGTGTSWTICQLPDPPILTGITPSAGGDIRTGWGCSWITDCQQMDLCFSHNGAPSETPTVIYFANYWYANNATTPLGEIVTAWWNGSAWTDVLQTKVSEVWGMGDPPTGFGTLGQGFWNWWSQGTRMVSAPDGTIYIVLALGHTQYSDRGVVGRLLPDSSAVVSLNPEIDPDQTGQGLWSWLGVPEMFSSGRWGGGWDYPSVTANVDPDGLLFIQFTGEQTLRGDQITLAKEIGTTDGWVTACKTGLPFTAPYNTETTKIVFDSVGNLYFLEFLGLYSRSGSSICVVKYPRVDYAPWTPTTAPPADFVVKSDYST